MISSASPMIGADNGAGPGAGLTSKGDKGSTKHIKDAMTDAVAPK